jgi:hypothetical protein
MLVPGCYRVALIMRNYCRSLKIESLTLPKEERYRLLCGGADVASSKFKAATGISAAMGPFKSPCRGAEPTITGLLWHCPAVPVIGPSSRPLKAAEFRDRRSKKDFSLSVTHQQMAVV